MWRLIHIISRFHFNSYGNIFITEITSSRTFPSLCSMMGFSRDFCISGLRGNTLDPNWLVKLERFKKYIDLTGNWETLPESEMILSKIYQLQKKWSTVNICMKIWNKIRKLILSRSSTKNLVQIESFCFVYSMVTIHQSMSFKSGKLAIIDYLIKI